MYVLAESQLAKIKNPVRKVKPQTSNALGNLYQLIEDASFILVPVFAYAVVAGRVDARHLNAASKYLVTLGCVALGLKFLRYLGSK